MISSAARDSAGSRRAATGAGTSMCCRMTAYQSSPMNGSAPGRRAVERDAERVDVGAAVEREAARLLGREVLRRARRSGCRATGCAASASARAMPKSATTALRAGVEQDVVHLDVAVDDAGAVRVGERLGHVAADAEQVALLERRRLGQQRRERAGRKSIATNGASPSRPTASTVTMCGWRSRAAVLASRRNARPRPRRSRSAAEHLERDVDLEIGVAGPVDPCEAAGPYQLLDLVAAERTAEVALRHWGAQARE
jgi:hypothetical protein